MEKSLDAGYWESRYRDGQTGWDIGFASTPLTKYFDQLTDKSIHILIPGCGNAYEADYLYRLGFKNVFLLDFAKKPLLEFQERHPDLASSQLICMNFFEHQGKYDLIIEQTFFCALEPTLRPAYASKMLDLLKPDGKIAGLLFNCQFEQEGPPFGGTIEEYKQYFEPLFRISQMVPCTISIPPRAGKELFIEFIRP